jgi:hypothetical protein
MSSFALSLHFLEFHFLPLSVHGCSENSHGAAVFPRGGGGRVLLQLVLIAALRVAIDSRLVATWRADASEFVPQIRSRRKPLRLSVSLPLSPSRSPQAHLR